MKLQNTYSREKLNSIGKQRFQGKDISYFNERPLIVNIDNNIYKPYLKVFAAMLEENKLY